MKTMNLLKSAAVIAAMAMSMAACNNEDVINDEQKSDKLVEVSLNCAGEIKDMGDVPMSRAGESNDLYYVQAYTIDESNNGLLGYADGLFDNVSDMKIKLKESDRYLFFATLIQDGKSLVYADVDSISGSSYYLSPFDSYFNNEFSYLGSFYSFNLTRGTSVTGVDQDGYLIAYDRPNQVRYYGQSEEYTPAEGGVVNINMARVSFGARIEVENMQEGDAIWVNIEGTQGMYIGYPETTLTNCYSLFNLMEAYNTDLMSDGTFANNYSENVLVSVYRFDSENNLFKVAEKYVDFRRNMIKTLKVNITDNSTANSVNMNIDREESWYGDPESVDFVGGVY